MNDETQTKADLPRGGTVLSRDERPIQAIFYNGSEEGWTADRSGGTEIVAYDENGQGAPVPWIAILKNGRIQNRIPAHLVEVYYAPAPEGA